ncbi:MAG: hypothetical protein ABEI27_06120 [Halobellus sp.]|uniref:hypothetical protein n=1 Tax=Halobellus sp. TaxID=1979212 RepID=UPI0035D4667E
MTDVSPVSPEEFASAVGRLDRDEFAAFIGALRGAEAGVYVEVDGPVVTVHDETDRTSLLAGLPDSAADTDRDFDAVVRSGDGPSDDLLGSESEVSVLTPDDLRRRLLYALSPDEAESLCEEFLGMPARSSAYVSPGTETAESPENATEETATSAVTASGSADPRPSGLTGNAARGRPPSPRVAAGAGTSTSSSTADSTSATADQRRSPALAGWTTPRRVAAVVLVVFIAVSGAAAVGGLSPGDAMGALSGSGGGASGATSPPTESTVTAAEPTTAEPGTSTGAGMEAEAVNLSNTTENDSIDRIKRVVIRGGSVASSDTPVAEAVRNTRPEPTCNRSFLLVTQIQMNALRYNDNESNEGIQTVRRFASPTNRRAIDSFSEFREVITGPTYSAMLSWDTVQYEPERLSDDAATVDVVTRENGTVTGRYEFYMQRIDGGRYDGCWMTDAVLTSSPR